MTLPQGGHLFYIDIYREKTLNTSCLKLESPGLWYLIGSFIYWISTNIIQIVVLGSKMVPSQVHLFYSIFKDFFFFFFKFFLKTRMSRPFIFGM